MQNSDNISALTGSTLGGRYHLLRLIKTGGMGAVYEARDIKLERPVAVKILNTELTQQPDMVRRLFREARAASQVRHPNIVEYLDYDQITDGPAYLVMEMLNGGDLERVLKQRGPIPWVILAPWMRQACRALSASHAVGVIHRDIKPSNFVLVEPPGDDPILKLVDFGIVKLTPLSGLRGDTEMTQHLLGTEMFMAPELFSGVTPNPRTEVYALGVSIYRLLTGTYPRSETGEPPSPSYFCPSIPPEVDALVARCLSLHPVARFESMEALDAEIRQTVVDAGPPPEPPTNRVLLPSIATPAILAPPRGNRWMHIGAVLTTFILIAINFGPGWSIFRPHFPRVIREVDIPGPLPPWDGEVCEDTYPDILADPLCCEDANLPTPIEPIAPFSEIAATRVLRSLTADVVKCGKDKNILPHSSLQLRVSIAPSGKANAKVTTKFISLDHAKCIVKAVKSQRFEPSIKGGRLTYIYRP